jgi:hypothetical protein
MSTCSVGDQSFESMGTNWWRAGTTNATIARCIVSVDIDAGSYGFWVFESSGLGGATAKYNDPPSSANGASIALTCFAF